MTAQTPRCEETLSPFSDAPCEQPAVVRSSANVAPWHVPVARCIVHERVFVKMIAKWHPAATVTSIPINTHH